MATRTKTAPKTAVPVMHIKLPEGATRPDTCGKLFELVGNKEVSAATCKRLPRHHGEHKVTKPRGLMTPAERKAASKRPTKTARPAAETVELTFGKQTVRVTKADGKFVIRTVRKVRPVVEERVVASPAKVTRRTRSITSGQPSARLA